MLRLASVLSLITAACGAIAFAVSHLVSAPPGTQHSCPSIARGRWACQFPPDQQAWAVHWMRWGLLIGLLAGLVVCLSVGRHLYAGRANKAGMKPNPEFLRA